MDALARDAENRTVRPGRHAPGSRSARPGRVALASKRARTRRMTWVAALASAVVLIARELAAGNPVHGVWAEDGAVFLQDAMRHPWTSLNFSYAGYGHLVDRILAESAHLVGIDDWPKLILVTTVLVMSAISAVVFRSAKALGLHTYIAFAAALVIVLLPGGGQEQLGNWSNLQFFLAYGLAWVLLVPIEKCSGTAAFYAFLAVAGGIASVLVLPLVFVHGRRRWYKHPAIPGIGLALLYQVIVAATSATAKHVPHRPLVRNPHVAAYLVRDLVVNPSRMLVDSGGGLLRAYHWTFLGVVLLVGVAVAILLAPRERRRLGLALLLCAGVELVLLSVLNGAVAFRYACFGVTLVAAALLVTFGAGATRGRRLPLVLAGFGLLWLLSLPFSPYRLDVPSWSGGVRHARAACAAPGADSKTLVRIKVGPTGWGATELPCSDLG